MRVGLIGLGKLGLPVAAAMTSQGVEVHGYDPKVGGWPQHTSHEEGLAEAIADSGNRMHFCRDMTEVVAGAKTIFVAVQTPHEPRFEGVAPLPEERADFDYSYLRSAVEEIAHLASILGAPRTIVVISTVLPGTMRREIDPLLGGCELIYNPSFIAMGTTIRDFLDPEFVLLGGDDGTLLSFYRDLLGPLPAIRQTSIPNAELIKVAYNTFIGLKIAFANTLMEVCHKTDCDVDEVTGALKAAKRRLISGAYLDGGMGDGGACHPRDNIALSWLARELDLSFDLFQAAMVQREEQCEWLVDLMCEYDLPKGVLGVSYKPESSITTGSSALLVSSLLHKRGIGHQWRDARVGGTNDLGSEPRLWLIGCKHPEFSDLTFPKGSVVIDPFRYIPDQDGVEVIRIGQRAPADHGSAEDGRALRSLAA